MTTTETAAADALAVAVTAKADLAVRPMNGVRADREALETLGLADVAGAEVEIMTDTGHVNAAIGTIALPHIHLPRIPSTSPRAASHVLDPEAPAPLRKTSTRLPAHVRRKPAGAPPPAPPLAHVHAPGRGPDESLEAVSKSE